MSENRNKKISFVIAEDHTYMIDGLEINIKREFPESTIHKARNGTQAYELIKQQACDILLTDICMPEMGGIELSKKIRKEFPDIKIVVLTQFAEIEYIHSLLKLDTDAIVLKNSERHVFSDAINAVINGEAYYCTEIHDIVFDFMKRPAKEEKIKLTKREIEILQLIAKDYTNKQIAEEINRSPHTVDTFKRSLFAKFEVHSIVALVRKAIKLKFIDP